MGLTTAYSILKQSPDSKLLLLEKETSLGFHQTGRNSGVIHSGIYYKPGSLKAKNCRKGYQLLLEFCRSENIPHDICGKLIIATSEQEREQLNVLHQRGVANGLKDIRRIPAKDISKYEPAAIGTEALHVPETGIIEYSEVVSKLAEKIKTLGGEIRLNEPVKQIDDHKYMKLITTQQNIYEGETIIACAGLQSDRIARQNDPELPLRIIPFRGEYYDLVPEKRDLVKNLIYPVPDPSFPFLGVHFTRMMNGGVEAGPNAVLALSREAYKWSHISPKDLYETLTWPGFWTLARKYWKTGLGEIHRSLSKTAFTEALQKLIPSIQESDLIPGNAGVRAQACHIDGTLLDDFHITKEAGIIHVCNAPSPAATSSLAIGENIAAQISWTR